MELTFDKASFGKRFGVNVHERSDDPSALNIYEATERSFSLDVPASMRDSALEYELKLYNGASVRALIYLVYAEPLVSGGPKVPGQTPALGLNGAPLTDEGSDNAWLPVTRARCAKGCAGPILSAIQRFGKQGRTQKGAGKEPAKPETGQDKWKDARNLFISIDEASNHVCAFGPNKCKVFRCVSVAFFLRERSFSRKLGTGEQSRDSRNANHEKRTKRPSRADAGSRALPSSAPPKTTDFCSGSSPRTATRSWAAASPALSASSPTTTCPRARRVSASAARSEVRAAPRQTIRLPPPDASRARPEGIPGASRGRARASRLIPNDTARRPRPPPGAPGRPRVFPISPRAPPR